jgi:hypothetical protein
MPRATDLPVGAEALPQGASVVGARSADGAGTGVGPDDRHRFAVEVARGGGLRRQVFEWYPFG